MSGADPFLAQAVCDSESRLLCADEPLAGLQQRCGGLIPGAIAIPALRELVNKARRFGLKLARPIEALDGGELIRVWVEVSPASDGGCAISLRNWQTSPLPPEDAELVLARRAEIDRALAELSARLDKRQCLLTVESEAVDLAQLTAAMRAGVGQPWTNFVTLDDEDHLLPLHWKLLDGASLTVAGSARRWRASLVPQMVSGGEPTGFELCLNADIPFIQPLTVPQPQAAPPAGEGPAVGREVAPVLRLPIARIIANAETIRLRLAGPLQEEYSRYAGDIATAGQLMLELVEDLADLEVIESDGFSTAADHIDLGDAARRAAGILSIRARERGITLETPGEDEHLPAIAEFRRVLQVLLNLIGNAIRYTVEGSTVRVTLERAGSRARIIVADEGLGLSPEEQARIFDKFERLGRSGDGGSGLGLYISRRLARAMGGELSVESTKGEGARFVLEVPGDFEA